MAKTVKELFHSEIGLIYRWNREETITFNKKHFKEFCLEFEKLHDEALAEKDKKYGILLADRDKLEMYRHNRLKKSDFIYIQGKSLIIGTEGAYVIKSEFKEKIESLEE